MKTISSYETWGGYDAWKLHDPREHDDSPTTSKRKTVTICGRKCILWSVYTDDYVTPHATMVFKSGDEVELEEIAERHPRLSTKLTDLAKGAI